MAELRVSVPHRLPQGEALDRVKGLLGQVKQQYSESISNLRETWNGNGGDFTFRVMGLEFSGTLSVKPSEVEITGTLPSAASFFKDRIEAAIKDKVSQSLA